MTDRVALPPAATVHNAAMDQASGAGRRMPRLWRQGIAGQNARGAAVTVMFVLAGYAASLTYPVLNHGPNRLFLRTGLDTALPFVPVFVIPYVSMTPLIAVTTVAFLAMRVRLVRSMALAMTIAWAASYLCYFFFQTYVERPLLVGDDTFTAAIRAVYAGDNPYNAFPSLHVSLSTILAIHWLRFDRRVGTVVSAWVVLVIASTVLIRQHYLADIVGGLVVGVAASRLAWRALDRECPAPLSVPATTDG